jgi:predicted small secreted protein
VRRGPSRISILRAAVVAAVGNNTLRGVARDIGLSAPAVQNFIDGAEPRRPSTLQKLEGWYVRQLALSGDELSIDSAKAAVFILVRDLPEEYQLSLTFELLDLIATRYSVHLGAVPQWIEQLRTHLREAADSK